MKPFKSSVGFLRICLIFLSNTKTREKLNVSLQCFWGAVARVMCNPFLIYRPGFVPVLHLCPCVHSMDFMGKSAQGSHDTTTAGWEEVSAELGATGFRAASQEVAVSVTDKLKTSQHCALVTGKPPTS